MNSSDNLSSFRVGPSALRQVLARHREAALGQIPSAIFNWVVDGFARTALLPADAEFRLWIKFCQDWDIVPVLIIASEDEVPGSTELDELCDMGVELVEVHNGEEQTARDGEWTIEQWLSLPDWGVIEAYYSSVTTRPLSAWDLQGQIAFWVAYGLALKTWARQGSFLLEECPKMYFEHLPGKSTTSLRPSEFRIFEDEEGLADWTESERFRNIKKRASCLRLPFVFDVFQAGRWETYGRLPGLHVEMLPVAALARDDSLIQQLRQAAESMILRTRFEAGAPIERTAFDLYVLDCDGSGHPDFPVGKAVGALTVGPDEWKVTISKIRRGTEDRECLIRIAGLLDVASMAPIMRSVTVGNADPERLPFMRLEVKVQRGEYQLPSDTTDSTKVVIEVDDRTITCECRVP